MASKTKKRIIMVNKMSKRDRDTIAGIVSLLFLAGSWYLLFKIIPDTNVYIKFG